MYVIFLFHLQEMVLGIFGEAEENHSLVAH